MIKKDCIGYIAVDDLDGLKIDELMDFIEGEIDKEIERLGLGDFDYSNITMEVVDNYDDPVECSQIRFWGEREETDPYHETRHLNEEVRKKK